MKNVSFQATPSRPCRYKLPAAAAPRNPPTAPQRSVHPRQLWRSPLWLHPDGNHVLRHRKVGSLGGPHGLPNASTLLTGEFLNLAKARGAAVTTYRTQIDTTVTTPTV